MLSKEANMQKIMHVIRKTEAHKYQFEKLDSDVICLDTGAHFNNGRKFFQFDNIVDEK